MRLILSTVSVSIIVGTTTTLCSETVRCSELEVTTQPSNWQAKTSQLPLRANSISSLETEAITVEEWQRQIAQAETVTISTIELIPTNKGIELFLETNGELSAPKISINDNTVIADLANAVLNLVTEEEFLVNNPTEGIVQVKVSQLNENQVRISIIGTNAPPEINIQRTTNMSIVSVEAGTVTGEKPEENTIEIIATGEQQEDDYFVPSANTATRTDTSILDTPQSIQIVPQQVLEEQQILRVDQALRNVSNITGDLSAFGNGGNLTIRGFTTDTFTGGAILRDGYRVYDNLGSQETANVERIEVIKGPSSVLYGQNDPGGIINLVTKKPLFEPFLDIGLQIGSFGLVRPTIDASGPLTDDRSVRSRLNIAFLNENSYRGFDIDNNRFFVSPVLTWDITPKANFSVVLEYVDEKTPADLGIPARGTGIFNVPRDRVVGELDNFVENDSLTVGYDFKYQFNDDWTFNHGFRYVGQNYDNVNTLPFFVDEVTGDVTMFFADRRYNSDDYSIQTNVVGKFNTGSVKHTLLAGADFNFNVFREDFTRIDFNLPLILNVFNPVYGTVPRPDLSSFEPFAPFNTNYYRYGVFLQDQVNFGEQFILVGSLRYDTIDYVEENVADESDDKLSPRIGFIYKPVETVSIYGNYSQSFTPNFGSDINGNAFAPEEAEGFEVGVKVEFLDGKMFTTLAYFDITKQNVTTTDPNNPFFSVATGEQRSQGFEFDIVGEILPGWNIIANYAYTDARVTKDNTISEGNRLNNAPYNIFNIWTTYEIQDGDLEGLGFGLGFNYVGEREGDLANSFRVGDYFLTNMAVFYNQENWRMALNFNNIFDAKYISSTTNSRNFGNIPGAPFTVIGSVSVQF